MAQKTEEQIAAEQAEKAIRDAGYTPGMMTETGEAVPIASEIVEAPPKEEPPKSTEPEKPKWTDEEVASWRERSGWADREKERADRERSEKEGLLEENRRLRAVAGQPDHPVKVPERKFATPEEETQWRQGQQWLRENLPGLLPELVPLIPEEALSKHPALLKRDIGTFRLREELHQTRFLANFDSKDRGTVEERVLPELLAERQASGFKETYQSLWDKKKKAAKESARLLGLTLKEDEPERPLPLRVPETPRREEISIPPSLSGVRSAGGPPAPERRTAPMSSEEMRLYGFI